MDINGVSTASTTDAGSANRFADMSTEDFLKIMIQELQSQDPLNPQDTSKLMEQISSLRNIESQTMLQDQMKSMVSENQIASASKWIGQYVSGKTEDLQDASGVVSSMRVEDGSPILMVYTGTDTVRMPVDNVAEIQPMTDYDTSVTQSLLSSMLILNSNSLIGKTVEGTDDSGAARTGKVTSVSLTDGKLMLDLDSGFSLAAGSVTKFSDVP